MPRGFSPAATKNREAALKMLKAGKTPADVSEKLGCSISFAEQLASAHNLRKPKGVLTQLEICKIIHSLVFTNETIIDIADRYNISSHNIQRLANIGRKAGFDIHRPVGRPRKKH